MDFQSLVDHMGAMTCVVSVERLENGGHGDIRIVTGNRAYLDSIERPMGNVQMLTTKPFRTLCLLTSAPRSTLREKS